MKRGEASRKASKIVRKNRMDAHGDPEFAFPMIAELWNAYLYPLGNILDAQDVAMMMVLLKISRIQTGDEFHEDHYIDAIGYLDLAASMLPSNDKESN